MNKILLAAMLFCCNVQAGVLVIGDSISAQVHSWPTHLRDMTGDNVMVMAQNGRTIRDFTLPNDLVAMPNVDTVVYFLGANDVIKRTPIRTVAERALTQLRFLKDRNFRVIVVLVPDFGDVSQVNRILGNKARGLKMEIITLDWDSSLTYDGIHPLRSLSRQIASQIFNAI